MSIETVLLYSSGRLPVMAADGVSSRGNGQRRILEYTISE
jgi:hypothetical protein